MGLLMTMLGQTVGFPVPRGGAGNLSAALARRFTCNGGEIRCEAEVAHVIVEHGRAVGVELVGGERVRCRRAVVADVAAPILYGILLDAADLPPRVLRAMSRFILDPGTVKVDWAMDRPIPWATARSHAPGTVHVADSVDQVV